MASYPRPGKVDCFPVRRSPRVECAFHGFSTEIADLKRQADERSERLAQAQAIELELRTEKRNLEEREKARDLEMARKLDEEGVRLQQEISTRLEEEHARQVAEKDKRLSDAMKTNDELRRKLQQGSQQLQGEVLELALEDLISQTFPTDLVQPVPKGINGADIIQRVDAIVEAFVSMQDDLQEERRSTERRWAKREKIIQRVISNTSGMYGDLQGLVGSSLATIPALTAGD
jgi:hypothetical protein